MSSTDGLLIQGMRKLGGLIATLQKGGVQQIEIDRDGGVQHLKWSDPDLETKLKDEARLVQSYTPTGLRTALPAPDSRVIEVEPEPLED